MKYILFLRGVNVGGNNRVVMSEIVDDFAKLKFENTSTYINSGNVLFDSDKDEETINKIIADYFAEHFAFKIDFVILNKEQYQRNLEQLPEWWQRQDTWRYNVGIKLPTYQAEYDQLIKEDMTELYDNVQITKDMIFWGSVFKENYSRSFYSKLLKTPIYAAISVRNANTIQKLLEKIKK